MSLLLKKENKSTYRYETRIENNKEYLILT